MGATNQEQITAPALLNLSPAIPFDKAIPKIAPIDTLESGIGTSGKDGRDKDINIFFSSILENKINVNALIKTTTNASVGVNGNIPEETVLITLLSAKKKPIAIINPAV